MSCFKCFAVAVAVVSSATLALADGNRNAASKVLGNYGYPESASRAAAPAYAMPNTPMTDAQRSFSYQAPAPQAETASPCQVSPAPAAAATTANRPQTAPQAARRFSYQPTAGVYRQAMSTQGTENLGMHSAADKVLGHYGH